MTRAPSLIVMVRSKKLRVGPGASSSNVRCECLARSCASLDNRACALGPVRVGRSTTRMSSK